MNTRIRELAEQAGITIIPEPFDDATRSWNNTMEKFAELIIKECRPWLADDAFEEIKEHFGVE